MKHQASAHSKQGYRQQEPFDKAYKIGRVLGSGGFGVVYEGLRVSDNLPVAIKHIARSKVNVWGQVLATSLDSFLESWIELY